MSIALDGWSNLNNEPIMCISVNTVEGDSYLIDTIDTSGHQHTSSYLLEEATLSIENIQKNFGYVVTSFVTDNASNMVKMRNELEIKHLITYGCGAHYMNLLAKDVEIPGIKEHVVIMKYFRNSHLLSAWFKSAGGKKLIMPHEVRWNTLADCLESYIEN